MIAVVLSRFLMRLEAIQYYHLHDKRNKVQAEKCSGKVSQKQRLREIRAT